MIYRAATEEDWPKIAQFLADTKYFLPVDPSTLGGQWLLAINDSNKVQGTLWYFHMKPHAFIDYWAASSSRVAAKLGIVSACALKTLGVIHVRATIADDNKDAMRLATDGFGMTAMTESTPVYKRL